MGEVMKKYYDYRTFHIKWSAKTNKWNITRSNGAACGTEYATPKQAKDYIDDILKPVKLSQVMQVELEGEQDRRGLKLED